MTNNGGPTSSSVIPWRLNKKSGSQNRNSHQIGSVMNLPIAKAHVWRRGSRTFQGIVGADEPGGPDPSTHLAGRWYRTSHSTSQKKPVAPVTPNPVGQP